MARKKKAAAVKLVDEALLKSAFAAMVASGDIVNFRLLFGAFSPGRVESTERFEDSKYEYLQPSQELRESDAYRKAEELFAVPEQRDFVWAELAAKRPAQLPWEPVMLLADNAVRLGKHTSAAQAYELLRIRRRMQETFFDEADAAIGKGDLAAAVQGFRIGAALAYDYGAFPEPLPVVPDYQKRALMVHGRYPQSPDDGVAVLPSEEHTDALIAFLLNESEAVVRLRKQPEDTRVEFVCALVRQVDPEWDAFAERYREACVMTRTIGEALQHKDKGREATLKDEIAEQQAGELATVMAHLLGHELPSTEWWEYLKQIANRNPAAIFFITRQLVGDREVLIPRYRGGSRLPEALGLAQD